LLIYYLTLSCPQKERFGQAKRRFSLRRNKKSATSKKNLKEKEKLSRFALEREIAVHGKPVIKLRERN